MPRRIDARRIRLAHVTDLHFGAEDPAVAAALRADLVTQDVDRVLVSGDLTMRARAGQFRAAATLLDSLGCPWTCVPGNHDLPLDRVLSRAVHPLAAYRRLVNAEPQPAVSVSGLRVLGLSTPRRYLWKGGRIGAAQAARIETALAGPARLKVLMTHHPLFRTPQRPSEATALGVLRALNAAARASVDLLLCGHGHVQAQVELCGPGRTMIGVMSGTACSRRVRAGESQSYTVLELSGEELRLTVRHWRGGRFDVRSETEWHRTEGGWHR